MNVTSLSMEAWATIIDRLRAERDPPRPRLTCPRCFWGIYQRGRCVSCGDPRPD